MTVEFALRWFELDPNSIDDRNLKKAFRRRASELHPDKTSNDPTEMRAAHEYFIAAIRARDLIASAITRGEFR